MDSEIQKISERPLITAGPCRPPSDDGGHEPFPRPFEAR